MPEHTPKPGDILYLPERVYNKWEVGQVYDKDFTKHLIDYHEGDIVFTIRPIAIDDVEIPKSKGNLLTRITTMLELRYEIHRWEEAPDGEQ